MRDATNRFEARDVSIWRSIERVRPVVKKLMRN